ncbi:MAG TPA: TonB C-terminal domain-containing protein [Candidatus Acidoferrales bacterium]
MISRILVPTDASNAPLEERGSRRPFTYLDNRMVVPADMPVAPLDTESTIPDHVPLDVLGERVVVPRNARLDSAGIFGEPLTVLDKRTVVPKGAHAPEVAERDPIPPQLLPELLEPDVLTTGEVHLMPKPVEGARFEWQWQAKVSSFVFHSLLILLILLQPRLPGRVVTEEDVARAHRQLGMIYLPPEVLNVPREAPRPNERQSDVMRIDPDILRKVAPPNVEPTPLPGPVTPPAVTGRRDAQPQPSESSNGDREDGLVQRPTPQPQEPRRELARAETPQVPPSSGQLIIPPSASPGRRLEDSMRGAMRGRGGAGVQFGDPVPPSPGAGGGGGQGYLGGAVQMLTPDEGVDFNNYLARVLASVRRNWYAVIPQSARLGEKGRVVLQFRIMKDGGVPVGEPALVASSGRDPLDRAASSSIRASHPFEPLPAAFSGPYIELRFIFLYNLPLEYQ